MSDLAQVYTILFQRWKAKKQQRNEIWIADASHQCNSKERCTITNLYTRVYEIVQPGSGKRELHVCTEECNKHALHRAGKLRATLSNIFICEHTGKFHVCTGSSCTEASVRSVHGEQVCRMSGLTRGSEFHDTYTAPVDKSSYAISNSHKRKRVDLYACDEGSGSGGKNREEEEWLSSLELDSKSKNITLQLVDLLLFSKKRRELEASRLKKMAASARATVTTYIRRCGKSGCKPVCVMYAKSLYEKSMQDSRPPPYMELSRQVAERIVEYYAHFCMLLYARLRKYVFLGEEDVPSLKECTPAILYIMREGLKTSSGAPLITVDMFLDCMLPEENTLDHFDIKKTQFTRVRNRIAGGTSTSIEDRHLCPAQLSITPLCMEDIVDVQADTISHLFIQANPLV